MKEEFPPYFPVQRRLRRRLERPSLKDKQCNWQPWHNPNCRRCTDCTHYLKYTSNRISHNMRWMSSKLIISGGRQWIMKKQQLKSSERYKCGGLDGCTPNAEVFRRDALFISAEVATVEKAARRAPPLCLCSCLVLGFFLARSIIIYTYIIRYISLWDSDLKDMNFLIITYLWVEMSRFKCFP